MNNLFPFHLPCRSLLSLHPIISFPTRREKKPQKNGCDIPIPNPFAHLISWGPPPPKTKAYHGRASTELYLHCYQLILWKQCYALIHTIGLPPELESVIKDLWALRLQLLKERLSDPDQDGELLFNSQPEVSKSDFGKWKGGNTNDEADEEEDNQKGKKVKVRGRDMPTLIESLGTCYLAMILLRLPIGLGDLQRYCDIHRGEEGGGAVFRKH